MQIGTADGGGGDADDSVGVVLDRWAGDVGDCYVLGRAVVDEGLHCGVEAVVVFVRRILVRCCCCCCCCG